MVLIGIAAAVGAATLIAQCFIPAATQVIDPGSPYANGGNSFQIDAALFPKWNQLFEIRSDQNDYPRQSNLVVLEDGKPLGPPHSVHVEIKEKGGGRYSHWVTPTGSMVIFSTSDNSDPRTNGRSYEIAARPVPSLLSTSFMLLLPLLLLVLQRLLLPQHDLKVALMAGVSIAGLIAWVSLFSDQVALAPDSTAYVHWIPIVPLGYPLFLSGVKTVMGSLGWAGTIQIILLISACLCLAVSMKNVVRGGGIDLATLLLLLCYIPMFWYAGWLLSEALFVPLILLNVAVAFCLIVHQKKRHALILAITAALILFVRPAGYYIPLGIVFLLIAQQGRTRWMLKWVCLPFAICTIATLLINIGVRGDRAPSQMGRVMFPTVAFLFEPQFVTGPYQELALVVEEALKPHREGYIKAPDRATRIEYSMYDYNPRLAAMDKALIQKCAASARQCYESRESLYLSLFRSTVFNRPLGYANLIVEQMIEAWRVGILATNGAFRSKYLAEANDLPARLEQIKLQGLPLRGEESRLRPDLVDAFPGRFAEAFDEGYRFIREQRWFIYLIGIVTLIAIPVAIFSRRDSVYWLSLGYCGVMIHGSILLTVAVSAFIPRYALPVDPVVLVSSAIMILGFISWSLSKVEQVEAVAVAAGLLWSLGPAPEKARE